MKWVHPLNLSPTPQISPYRPFHNLLWESVLLRSKINNNSKVAHKVAKLKWTCQDWGILPKNRITATNTLTLPSTIILPPKHQTTTTVLVLSQTCWACSRLPPRTRRARETWNNYFLNDRKLLSLFYKARLRLISTRLHLWRNLPSIRSEKKSRRLLIIAPRNCLLKQTTRRA